MPRYVHAACLRAAFSLVTLLMGCQDDNPKFSHEKDDQRRDPKLGQDSSSDTSKNSGPQPWNSTFPAPHPDAGDEDHCQRGAKGCFVFTSHEQTQLESQTPGYPGMMLQMSKLGPAPEEHAKSKTPLSGGVHFDGQNASIQTKDAFPRYKGQDFGIEIWYRSDKSPDYGSKKSVMLVQALTNVWLQEHVENGSISCAMPSSAGEFHLTSHGFQVGPNSNSGKPRDHLRVVACGIRQDKLYIFSNGRLLKSSEIAQDTIFRVQEDVTDQPIAIGGWVIGNDIAPSFARLQGTVYMVRIWNNLSYMKQVMRRELNYHGMGEQAQELAEIPD